MADNDDFQITFTTQPGMTQIGKLALARLIVAHIKQGLDQGTWVLVGGKAVPRALLHFFEEKGIIEIEEIEHEANRKADRN